MVREVYTSFGAAALLVASAAPAHAFFLLNDWRFDACGSSQITCPPSTVGGQEQYNLQGLDSLTFRAVGTSVTDDTNGNVEPDDGEIFRVTASGVITGFFDGGTDISPLLYGQDQTLSGVDGWQLTFEFDVSGVFFDKGATTISFSHLAAGQGGSSGLLSFYLTNLVDNPPKADVEANTGITNGEQIAQFAILAGDGGAFSFITGDGSDDASFSLLSAVPGIWFDETGADLSTKVGNVFGLSDGNFDSRSTSGTPFGFSPSGFNCGNTPVDFCFDEDGSFNLAAVPAPGTLALFGLGLAGLGARKRIVRRK
jgi:hypothetical protein